MMLLFLDSDFNGPFNDAPPDPYYADVGIGYFDPFLLYVLLALMVTMVVAVGIGAYIGRRQAAMRLDEAKRRSVDHIYGSIRYKLDQALEARGLAIIERAALVRDEVHNRLGHVMALVDKPGKNLAELEKSLPPPGPAKPEKPRTVKVKIAMSAEEQMIAVWESLNAFRVFWSNEAYVRGLIRAAQDELARTDSLAYVRQLEAQYLPAPELVRWRPAWLLARKAGAAAVVAGALNDADKAGATPVVTVAPLPEPDPTSPPAPPKPARKKLPAHKRNMLA
ncbi:hypothetical protein [Asticcacaulis sp.]|uniref:hypothetical protein n=1 Tax=Asticcacaulis sp. TaxID=1872648 RepID=UPI002C936236|nr:hypothetical protein [Asticcacaulis sp.]HTM79943.1 hypothetical protein [Asticcacaulis sp.]